MTPSRKKGSPYTNWDEYPEVLQVYIDTRRRIQDVVLGSNMIITPHRSTIDTYIKRMDDHEKDTKEKLTVQEWIEKK